MRVLIVLGVVTVISICVFLLFASGMGRGNDI